MQNSLIKKISTNLLMVLCVAVLFTACGDSTDASSSAQSENTGTQSSGQEGDPDALAGIWNHMSSTISLNFDGYGTYSINDINGYNNGEYEYVDGNITLYGAGESLGVGYVDSEYDLIFEGIHGWFEPFTEREDNADFVSLGADEVLNKWQHDYVNCSYTFYANGTYTFLLDYDSSTFEGTYTYDGTEIMLDDGAVGYFADNGMNVYMHLDVFAEPFRKDGGSSGGSEVDDTFNSGYVGQWVHSDKDITFYLNDDGTFSIESSVSMPFSITEGEYFDDYLSLSLYSYNSPNYGDTSSDEGKIHLHVQGDLFGYLYISDLDGYFYKVA